MSVETKAKLIAVLSIIILIIVLALFGSGSQLINNYNPGDSGTAEEDENAIVYNNDVLNEIVGGYTGPPTLIASDDKVFYIPPGYCDGDYLRNFRVIGVNQTAMAKKEKTDGGDISDYNGVVILYGFQTTYREDYGTNYDFDYEPYDYNVEYEVVDSFFEQVVLGGGDASEYYMSGNSDEEDETEADADPNGSEDEDALEENTEEGASVVETTTEATTYAVYMPGDVKTEKNYSVVDDSEFKVATVVMEHEIGKDECKILFCDADSATVEELDQGRYNLITNMSNDALTVCFNEKMYVYSYDTDNYTYATNDVYFYDLNDLFKSATYNNSLVEAGYCDMTYVATGIISFDTQEDTWVKNWLKHVETKHSGEAKTVTYLSNLTGDKADKDDIHNDVLDMETFLADAIEDAFRGYKKSTSGWLAYKHETSVVSFSNYSFENLTNNSWTLTADIKVKLYEKSFLFIFPKSYTAYPTGKVTLSIVPDYTVNADYNYTIDDLILTKYESVDSAASATSESGEPTIGTAISSEDVESEIEALTDKKYSMIMQLMISPVEESGELETVAPIEDFAQYLSDINNGVGVDDTPDVDEDYFDSIVESGSESTTETTTETTTVIHYVESEEDKEETVKAALSTKYLTFNINLSQVYETVQSENINILTITDANLVKEEIDALKDKYLEEYNQNVAVYATETKNGNYVVPKDYTVEAIEDFKVRFLEIKTCRETLEAAKAKLEKLYADLAEAYEERKENIEDVNDIADKYGVEDKTSYGDLGYYSEIENRLSSLSALGDYDLSTITDVRSLYKTISQSYIAIYAACLQSAGYYAERMINGNVLTVKFSDCLMYEGDLEVTFADGCSRVLEFCDYLEDVLAVEESNDDSESSESRFTALLTKMSNYAGSSEAESLTKDELEELIYLYEETQFMYDFLDGCTYKDIPSSLVYTTYISPIKANAVGLALTYTTDMKTNYAAAVYNSLLMQTDDSGVSLLTYLSAMSGILELINSYELETIPELEAQIEELEAELIKLKQSFDSSDIALDFYWNGTAVTGDFMDENCDRYDEITANADEYMSAFNTLLTVDDYRESADTVISNIETLNTDIPIFRVTEAMKDAVSIDTTNKYTAYKEDAVYVYQDREDDFFYLDISTALNNAANIGVSTSETAASSEDIDNTNIKLIKERIQSYYGSMGSNTVKAKSYTEILADCVTIFEELYDSFTRITTQVDGEDVLVCDVSVEDVYRYVCEYLIDEYEITVLTYVDEDNVERTTTIAKSNESGGNLSVDEETETTTANTSSAEGYEENLYAVYDSYSKILAYAEDLDTRLKNLFGLGVSLFYKSGCLKEEQIAYFQANPETLDQDVTSEFNVGFLPLYSICTEMPDLIEGVKIYYDTRKAAAAALSTAASKGMTVTLRDDRYYAALYKEKCTQADYLYRLLYNAAKATTEDERQLVIDEFNNKTDWLILGDIEVDRELTSVMKIETETITTTYQKVTWNTALINTDVERKIESIVTDDAYEMYQMDADFVVIINAERGYVVPMGAQADADVEALNTKIQEEIEERDIGDVENVAFGVDDSSGYQMLLFSGSKGWFLITFKETLNSEGVITIDRNNVSGYYGTYSTGETDDAHFLEYDHTNITGMNQFYSTTIENGFIPYDINLVINGSGTIEPAVEFTETDPEDPVTGIAEGSSGVEGAFFNAWTFTSNDAGNVILLGFKKEDMEVVDDSETETEADTEVTTYYSSDEATEETTEEEKTYREIVDSDIYEAHLYVYQYDLKPATASEEEEGDMFLDYYDLEYSMLSDEVASLTGPYGELVKYPVILLEYARVPVLILAYALLAILCIYLGVKYATSGDDPGKHEKAKQHIKWFIIGVLSIHILMGFLYCANRQLKAWQEDIAVETQTDEDSWEY